MIKVKNVKKSFNGFFALDDLDMNVKKGSIYGLVGPNGAGKSTIIRHLTGIFRQDSGDIEIDGKQVFENPEIKTKIAYIPDDIYYFLQATPLEMMRLYRGIFPSFDEKRYHALKEVFQIDEKQCIRRLSKGMQKQVAFWLAISSMPEILILDEPVDGLDPVMRRQVWSLIIGDVAERGTTVLVSSHNLRELEDVCDHVGIMNKGKILLEHSLSDLQDNIVKMQVVFAGGLPDLSGALNILHSSQSGRIATIIARGKADEVHAKIASFGPILIDILPLTLEEVFLYELGGVDYAVKNIMLS